MPNQMRSSPPLPPPHLDRLTLVAFLERQTKLQDSLQSAIRALRALDAPEDLVDELEGVLFGR